ncbi:tandem-95 repeat protein [Variovorax soli]|uniref:tandem-95 repeat protein n=1 Tax=Variovorax soli TaxID=376815 RepID=UPI000A8A2733|nr:tandem-95 repeat protein [Variovorax soli]
MLKGTTLTVTVNDPPVITDPPGGNPPGQTFDPATGAYSAITPEDAPFTGQVSATDADGDPLNYTLVGGPSRGTVTVDPATGAYVYTPGADFNGTDSFVIEIRDDYGGAVQATVNMTVTPVADIADDNAHTPRDTSTIIYVDANDTFENAGHVVSGINGGSITVGASVPVANGSVTLNADGTLGFTPNAGFTGLTSFTYTVSSGGVTETAAVVVNVLHVNAPPAAADPGDVPGQDFDPSSGNYRVTTPQDTAFSGRVGSADPDGDAILHELESPPSNGSVVLQPDGRYVYTPKPGYVGSDSFVVRMSDGQGGFITSTVFVDVTPVAQLATARDDFPFVFQPQAQAREYTATPFQRWHVNAEPTVVQAVNSARSLGGTRELTALSGVVLQAVNGVDSLDGTAYLGEEGAVLQAVNSVSPLYGSASYDRLDTSMERELLSIDATGPRAEVVSSLRLGDGLSVEFTAGRQQVSVELTSGEPVREVRATLADGRPLPPWMRMDSRGYLLMDRPAAVEQVRLRFTVVKQNGASVTHTIEIDFNAGELRQIPARGAGTRVGIDANQSGATALASAPAMDFVAQLERAAQRTSEADAQLLQALEAAG